MNRQEEFVLRTIEERDIRFVRLWFTDVLGTLKSVAVAPAELEALLLSHPLIADRPSSKARSPRASGSTDRPWRG